MSRKNPQTLRGLAKPGKTATLLLLKSKLAPSNLPRQGRGLSLLQPRLWWLNR